MRNARPSVILIILFAMTISGAPSHGQGLAPAIYGNISNAVVRVSASNCPAGDGSMTGERTLNGFFWGSGGLIVTSRHGIAGCRSVKYCVADVQDACTAEATASRTAHIEKTIARADLALLRADKTPDHLSSIQKSVRASINDEVFVIAHWLNAPAVTDKKIRIGNGSKTLADKLVGNAKQELGVLQSPSLDLSVLNLDGLIIDGVSGAPLVSKDGDLVGIIDGGLPNGVAGVNWAIPASELQELLSSTEPPPTVAEGRKTSIHHAQEFAMSAIDPSISTVSCGHSSYVRTKTVSLAGIATTTDDPLGLTQLMMATGFIGRNPSFDVYSEASSTGVIVVPAGAVVSDEGAVCLATIRRSPTAEIELRFGSRTVNSDTEAQTKSLEFETLISGNHVAAPNSQWSYPLVQTRYDGAGFRRKTFYLYSPIPGSWPPMMPHLEGYWFETFARKNESLLAGAVTYTSRSVDLAQLQFGCSPVIADCQSVAGDKDAWLTAVLAIHLTTFPVN